jgi:hypothetical protein
MTERLGLPVLSQSETIESGIQPSFWVRRGFLAFKKTHKHPHFFVSTGLQSLDADIDGPRV